MDLIFQDYYSGDSAGNLVLWLSLGFLAACILHLCLPFAFACLVCLLALPVYMLYCLLRFLHALLLACIYLLYLPAYSCFISCIMHV